jgi:hypothetical protein
MYILFLFVLSVVVSGLLPPSENSVAVLLLLLLLLLLNEKLELHTDFWLKILDRKKHLGKQAYM